MPRRPYPGDLSDGEYASLVAWKTDACAPYPIWLWLNGHSRAKRQLDKAGIAYGALDNGFHWCPDPAAPQRICNRLGASAVHTFFWRWFHRLRSPFTADDLQAGYTYDLAFRQFEVCDTRVFDRPQTGPGFLEGLSRDHLDLDRPDQVVLVFDRKLLPRTPGRFQTRSSPAVWTPSSAVPTNPAPQGVLEERAGSPDRDRHRRSVITPVLLRFGPARLSDQLVREQRTIGWLFGDGGSEPPSAPGKQSAIPLDSLTGGHLCATLSTNRFIKVEVYQDQLDRAFMALADPIRRAIVARLSRSDATLNELAQPFAITKQAISKHIHVLEQAGLVTKSRDAQRKPVHLDPAALERLTSWIDQYRLIAESRYRALDQLLQQEAPPSVTNPNQQEHPQA